MRYAVVVAVALAACGPSAAEIRQARDATYAMDAKHLLQVAMEAANELYGLGSVDVASFTFATKSFVRVAGPEHRGWADCARGGWRIEVRTTAENRSFVTITSLAQASLTGCKRRNPPSWVDVPPDDVGLGPDLDAGRDKLALAIHERASKVSN